VDYHKLKLKQNVLQDADLTRDIGEIVRESLRGTDEAVRGLLPAVSVQRSRLQKRRMRLLKDLGSRVIIFGLPSAADYIHRVKHIYIDGTFAITPVFRRSGKRNSTHKLPPTLEEALEEDEDAEKDEQHPRRVKFSQLYVVLAERSESDRVFVAPILHALLPNKTTATYDKLWRMIRTIYPSLNPTSFSSDYELAAIHAVVNSYHNSIAVLGCGFHYAQALTKQANKKKVEKLFREKTCLYVKVG
jgi:hypothetical protein